jgi:hypothetical protein
MATYQIDRIQGQVMPVNSFVIHGPSGIVVIDGMLTISDAQLVRRAISESRQPLAGVVITHPPPRPLCGNRRDHRGPRRPDRRDHGCGSGDPA